MPYSMSVFTSEDLMTEAPEEKIDQLLSTANPVFITPDWYLARRGFYRLLAKKLVWFGASRSGLMDATSSVFDASKLPPIFRLERNNQTGCMEWVEFPVHAESYYEAYGYDDRSFAWNTFAKRYSAQKPPIPAPELLPRFRVLDLFFRLIGSPII